jgi:hypothetical protein
VWALGLYLWRILVWALGLVRGWKEFSVRLVEDALVDCEVSLIIVESELNGVGDVLVPEDGVSNRDEELRDARDTNGVSPDVSIDSGLFDVSDCVLALAEGETDGIEVPSIALGLALPWKLEKTFTHLAEVSKVDESKHSSSSCRFPFIPRRWRHGRIECATSPLARLYTTGSGFG